MEPGDNPAAIALDRWISDSSTVSFDGEAGVWVARCFDGCKEIYSQGTTADEAMTALREGVALYLKHMPPRGVPT